MAETNNTTAAKWTGDPESYTPEKYIEASRSASSVPPLTTRRAAALQHMSSGRSIQAIAQAPSSSDSRQTMLPGR